MGHILDVGDLLDMLEESVMTKRPFVIRLRDGREFEDRVQEIIKWEGQDHVVFHDHELTPLHSISRMRRAWPPEYTYAGKRVTAGPHPEAPEAEPEPESPSGGAAVAVFARKQT
ncbi:MAG: hypothetical protein JWO36_1404 [Myxococcales bacterium]|nr:hypothetical protein [Myxococcales bacterium]